MYGSIDTTLNQIAYSRFKVQQWNDLTSEQQAALEFEVVALKEDGTGVKSFTSEGVGWLKWTVTGSKDASATINKYFGQDQDEFAVLQEVTGAGCPIERRKVDAQCKVGHLVALKKQQEEWEPLNSDLLTLHEHCKALIKWGTEKQKPDDPDGKARIEKNINQNLQYIVEKSTENSGDPFKVLEYLSQKREESMKGRDETSTSRISSQFLKERLEAMMHLQSLEVSSWDPKEFMTIVGALESLSAICANSKEQLAQLRKQTATYDKKYSEVEEQQRAARTEKKGVPELEQMRNELIKSKQEFFRLDGFNTAVNFMLSAMTESGVDLSKNKAEKLLRSCIPDLSLEHQKRVRELVGFELNKGAQSAVMEQRKLPTQIDRALDTVATEISAKADRWESLPESEKKKCSSWVFTFNSPMLENRSSAPDGWHIVNPGYGLLSTPGASDGAHQMAKDTNKELKAINDFCDALDMEEKITLMDESAKTITVSGVLKKRDEINDWATKNEGVLRLKALSDEFAGSWLRMRYQPAEKESEDDRAASRMEIEEGIEATIRRMIEVAVDETGDASVVLRHLQGVVGRQSAIADEQNARHHACSFAQKRLHRMAPVVARLESQENVELSGSDVLKLLRPFEQINSLVSSGVQFNPEAFDRQFAVASQLLAQCGVAVALSSVIVADSVQEPSVFASDRIRLIGSCASMLEQNSIQVDVQSVMKLVSLLDPVLKAGGNPFRPLAFDEAFSAALSHCQELGLPLQVACSQLQKLIPNESLPLKARVGEYNDLMNLVATTSSGNVEEISSAELVELVQSVEGLKVASPLADVEQMAAFDECYSKALIALSLVNIREHEATAFIRECTAGLIDQAGDTRLKELKEVQRFVPIITSVQDDYMVILQNSLNAFRRLKDAATDIDRKGEAGAALTDMLAIGMERPDCIDCRQQVKALQAWISAEEKSGRLFKPKNAGFVQRMTWQAEYYSTYLEPVFEAVQSCEAELDKKVKHFSSEDVDGKFDIKGWIDRSTAPESLKNALICRADRYKARDRIAFPEGFKREDYAYQGEPLAVSVPGVGGGVVQGHKTPPLQAVEPEQESVSRGVQEKHHPQVGKEVVQDPAAIQNKANVPPVPQAPPQLPPGVSPVQGPPPVPPPPAGPAVPPPPPMPRGGIITKKTVRKLKEEQDGAVKKEEVKPASGGRGMPVFNPQEVKLRRTGIPRSEEERQGKKTDVTNRTKEPQAEPTEKTPRDQLNAAIREGVFLRSSEQRGPRKEMSAAEQKTLDDKRRQAAKRGLDNILKAREKKRDELKQSLERGIDDKEVAQQYRNDLAATEKDIENFYKNNPGFVKGPLTDKQLAEPEKEISDIGGVNMAKALSRLKTVIQRDDSSGSENEDSDDEGWERK